MRYLGETLSIASGVSVPTVSVSEIPQQARSSVGGGASALPKAGRIEVRSSGSRSLVERMRIFLFKTG
jgi:hypothetical protein